MVQEFLKSDELEAFITGPAGSGKTTKLREVVEELVKLNINFLVVAYTHKAKDVLIKKLPEETPVRTLHSWLKKRPGINSKAKHMSALMVNKQMGKPDPLQVLIVDEFSFVGERDYFSIGELQDELELEGTGAKPIKVIYSGDLNQLSPVNDVQVILPHGPFWLKLTEIHRTVSTISKPLALLVEMIEGKRDLEYLEETEHFRRGQNILKLYLEDTCEDKAMFAYTNKSVQSYNSRAQGYDFPKPGDSIYSTTLKETFRLSYIEDEYNGVVLTPCGPIDSTTKYNPLGFLNSKKYVKFFVMDNGLVIPGIFGSYNNKVIRERLGKDLVNANKAEKDSRLLYREYKTVNDYVSQFDFTHCSTIHTSQGSEYQKVYIDSEDLSVCRDIKEQMKLLYVGMSRAREWIFMSN